MAIDVGVSEDLVVVQLTGPGRVFALKSRLEIPTERISTVDAMPKRDVPDGTGTWIRYPGTYVPGLIQHGSYGLGANREFWAVFRKKDVVVISVDDWDYRRVVLGTVNPAMDTMRLSQIV